MIYFAFVSREEGKLLTRGAFQEMIEFDTRLYEISHNDEETNEEFTLIDKCPTFNDTYHEKPVS